MSQPRMWSAFGDGLASGESSSTAAPVPEPAPHAALPKPMALCARSKTTILFWSATLPMMPTELAATPQ